MVKSTAPYQNALPSFDAPPGGRLTAAMIDAYADSGVIVLKNFVSLAACRNLQQRVAELVREFDPGKVRSVFSTTSQTQLTDRYFIESGDQIRFFLEANAYDESGKLRQSKEDCLNKMGHAMHDIDPVFDEFSHSPELDRVAKSLGIVDPVIIQSMYLFKPPRIGAEVVCHQDSTYIYTEPESCIGFWFALEDATIENGCVYFIPGGHRGPLRQRNHRLDDGTSRTDVLSDEPFDEDRKVAAEVSAGSLVIFDGRAPHMSGENRSNKSRHAYSLHVIDRRCHYPADNWLQRSPQLPLRGFV